MIQSEHKLLNNSGLRKMHELQFLKAYLLQRIKITPITWLNFSKITLVWWDIMKIYNIYRDLKLSE